jgi:hypothetical protein
MSEEMKQAILVGALEQAITDLAAEFGSPVPEAVI